MTFLLPSAQLRQVADTLRCAEQTGATITGKQAGMAAEYFDRLARNVERLETFAIDAERENFEAVFAPLLEAPAPAPEVPA